MNICTIQELFFVIIISVLGTSIFLSFEDSRKRVIIDEKDEKIKQLKKQNELLNQIINNVVNNNITFKK